MHIEFLSPSEESRTMPTWSPPNSPWLDDFCYSQTQSQINANYSSDQEFPWSPPSSDPFIWHIPICFGTLSQLELLTEYHDPWGFIKLSTLTYLIPPRGLLLNTPRLCLLHLTILEINWPPEEYRFLSQFPKEYLIWRLLHKDFPCLRVLRIGVMPYARVEFVDRHTTDQFDSILQSKQTRKADRHGPEPENFANGVELIIRSQYHVETMAGAVGTIGQSHAAATGITIVGKHGRRRKRKEAARIPSRCESASKRVCGHHGKMHWPIIKTDKDDKSKSKSESKGRHLSGKTAEAEAGAFNQSPVTTSPFPGAVGSNFGPARFSPVALEPQNVNEYGESLSEPCLSFESPLVSEMSTRRLPNDLLVRLRRINWSGGEDAASCIAAGGVLSDLELMRSYPPRSMWNCYVVNMLGACYPQTTNLLEFTFILYSQIEVLKFQASIMQQNIPPEMTEKLIVGVKELQILDDMLEAILAVQPMLDDEHRRQIKDKAVKGWLKKVLHIFHETLGVLTDCRTEIKKLHIERIHDCSTFHMKGFPCWLVGFTSVSIPRKFREILVLSKRLIKVNHFFLKFSLGHLVESHGLILVSIQMPGVAREMMVTMIPDSLELLSMEECDAMDVGSSDESHGHFVKQQDDLRLQALQTPELATEMGEPDSLEQPSMEECDAMDVGSLDESLGHVVKPHDDLTLQSTQTPELATEVGAPDTLEQPSMEECDAVDVADESLGHVVKLNDDLTLQSTQTPELVTDMGEPDTLEQPPTMEAMIKVGDVASSSQSLAALTVVDKQSNRRISFKKLGRTKKSLRLEVLLQHSSKTLEKAASSLRVGKSTLKRACREMGISHWAELKDINLTAKDGAFSQTSPTTSPLPSVAVSSVFGPANLNGCNSNQHIPPVALQPKRVNQPAAYIADAQLSLEPETPTEQIQEFSGSRHHRYCSYPPRDRLETTTTSVVHTSPPETTKIQEDARPVIVKATYKGDTTKFKLFSSSKQVDLEEKLAQKLKLKVGSFKIKYVDEDKDEILVSTDSDLEDYIRTSETQGNTTIRLLVEPTTKRPHRI